MVPFAVITEDHGGTVKGLQRTQCWRRRQRDRIGHTWNQRWRTLCPQHCCLGDLLRKCMPLLPDYSSIFQSSAEQMWEQIARGPAFQSSVTALGVHDVTWWQKPFRLKGSFAGQSPQSEKKFWGGGPE